MSSSGKWHTKWLPARAKGPADDEPLLRSYLGLDDDLPEPPPQDFPRAPHEPAPPFQRPTSPVPALPVPARALAAPPAAAPAPAAFAAAQPFAASPLSAPTHAVPTHAVPSHGVQPLAAAAHAGPPLAAPPVRRPAQDGPGAMTPVRRPAPAPQRFRMRAVIGDALRAPALVCEFGGCAARFTHPDALGERQLADLALAAGWQYDLIGRLACPSCVRHAPTFWSRPQALTRQAD